VPKLDVTRRIWALLIAVAVAVAVGSCDAVTISPSASPRPPTAPLMRYQSSSAWELDGSTWTFKGSVNPNGSPTDVVLEVGSGTPEAPIFDRSLPVGEGLILPEAFEFQATSLVAPFCVRFTARNEVGETSTPASCPLAPRLLSPPDPGVGPTPSSG
jgi:hypothetical protein